MSTPSPAFDGQCAFAVSLNKTDVTGSSKHAVVVDEQTFLFKNGVAKMLFKILPGRSEKAQANWQAMA